MNIKLYFFFFLFILTSCVSKEEYEQLRNENEELHNEIQSLKNIINDKETDLKNNETTVEYLNAALNELREEKTEVENQLNRYRPKGNILDSKTYSEQEAINTVNDYYNFYERNYVIRNIQVRRKSNASFWVSYEKANRRNADRDFFYSAETKILEFYENNHYQLKDNR